MDLATSPQKQTRKPFERICAYCGKKFITRSYAARYCCNAHRQASYRLRLDRVIVTGESVTDDDPKRGG